MSWCWLWSVLLVQTGAEVPLLRFVDFGCGCLLEDSYTQFDGTTKYTSPEFFTQGSYQAEPTTVWQIGVILFNMLCQTNQVSLKLRESPAFR
ncbi:serine/threonine-protein kinase pim-2-like [Astyanax mexicanus]|uniref:non-specific serine/threonine protein kinase n=1 Tax=Astyanax mexicanus TaxID=7994 RepID=A0A8T2MIQ9_ASTMX|nr:serine/threonine-protein kinase pim-2-like [Astyanax mexicanus]